MARLIGIIGDTGYGKSMSFVVPPDGIIKKDKYEGIEPDTTIYFNIDGKPLPFTNYTQMFPVWKEKFKNFKDYKPTMDNFINWLEKSLKKEEIKNIVIDTFSFGMFKFRMKQEAVKGYEKWTKLNIKFWNILEKVITDERDDLFVWLLLHSEEGKDREGNTVYKAKVEGNLLDKVPEKIMSNVFFATKKNDKYVFETQANQTTAKNPPLLFDDVIPNSLKLIEDTLRGTKLYNNPNKN